MTAQMHNRFLLDGDPYAIVKVRGFRLFHPRAWGLRAVDTSTACSRGYLTTYTVKARHLVLDQLEINLPGSEGSPTPPRINGVKPWKPRGWAYIKELLPDLKGQAVLNGKQIHARLEQMPGIDPNDPHTRKDLYSFFEFIYDEIGLEIDFTGRILIAQDFIRELYVHAGFHPAWKFETVLELIFWKGRLLVTHDVSGRISSLRSFMRTYS